ncbi:MAG: hypothetical protein J7K49_00825 [Thaumarchaeota archaeon]|nr:hypothetical protein [Nitrososphaerota archaeon]
MIPMLSRKMLILIVAVIAFGAVVALFGYRYPQVVTTTMTITTTLTSETDGSGSVSGGSSEKLASSFIIGHIENGSKVHIKVEATGPVLVLVTDAEHALIWDLAGAYQDEYVLMRGLGTSVELNFTPPISGEYGILIGKTAGYLGATYLVEVTIVRVETITTVTTFTTERGLLEVHGG